MIWRKWIVGVTVVLALGSQVQAGFVDPPGAGTGVAEIYNEGDDTPGMTISFVYDYLIGQTFLRVNEAPPHMIQLSATMGLPSLDPLLRHLAFASLTTSPALRAPREEEGTEEQQQTEEQEQAADEQESPLTPKQRYRQMLRTTQALDLVPVTRFGEK